MELGEKISKLEELFETEEGELLPETVLDQLDAWDSMTKLSLIVLMDEDFQKRLTGDDIRKFITIQDILNFMN